jgi:hypothetical protein
MKSLLSGAQKRVQLFFEEFFYRRNIGFQPVRRAEFYSAAKTAKGGQNVRLAHGQDADVPDTKD